MQTGDILVAGRGTAIGENQYLFAAPDAVFAEDIARFQFVRPELARFVGVFMRTSAYADYLAHCLTDPTQGEASMPQLTGASIALPPKAILQHFNTLLAPLDERLRLATQQLSLLPQTRETLWEKLFAEE